MKSASELAVLAVILTILAGTEGARKCWRGFSGQGGWLIQMECPGSCLKRAVPRGIQYGCWELGDVPAGCRQYYGRLNCYCNTPLCNTGGVPASVNTVLDYISPSQTEIKGYKINVKQTRNAKGLYCWFGFSGPQGWITRSPCYGSCAKRNFEKGVEYGCWDNKVADGCRKVRDTFFCFCNKNYCNTGKMPKNIQPTGDIQTDMQSSNHKTLQI